MQIWLFFHGGAGGDSLANLLEHCRGVKPFDGLHRWRVHRYVDKDVKFWAPCVDVSCGLRQGQPFRCHSDQLHSNYMHLIAQGHTTVVTSHDLQQTAINDSDLRQILTQDRVVIWVRARDERAGYRRACLKNLKMVTPQDIQVAARYLHEINRDFEKIYQHQIYFDDIFESWAACDRFVQELGLELDEKIWQDWRQVCLGQRVIHGKKIKHFVTFQDQDSRFQYREIAGPEVDNAQPT